MRVRAQASYGNITVLSHLKYIHAHVMISSILVVSTLVSTNVNSFVATFPSFILAIEGGNKLLMRNFLKKLLFVESYYHLNLTQNLESEIFNIVNSQSDFYMYLCTKVCAR